MAVHSVLASLLFALLLSVSATAAERPMRLLLDEEFSWMDQAAADRLVANAKRAGFNVLVPCVWHGRGVTWRSRLPKEPRWENNPRALPDPLQYLIARAHEAGLEVHPWFTLVKRQRDFYPEFLDPGVPDDAFDVHNPRFRTFIRDVVLEVVDGYAIDGVNLDYVRSRGVCLSERCRADYERRTGRNLAADNLSQRLSAESRSSIGGWNRRSVEDLLRSISGSVRARKPGLMISVSSHAGYEPLRLEGTNSIGWANAGLIDYILHIEYATVDQMRRDLLDIALKNLNDPSRLIMIAGNYEVEKGNKRNVWPRDPPKVAEAIRFASSFNKTQAGAALYEYRFMTEDQISAIASAWEFPAVRH